MAERTVTIGSKVGLHARPASLFVKAAGEAGIPVKVAKEGGTPVDATSILGIMTLGAKYQDSVTLTAEGERAEEVLDSLADLLSTDLDEK
ncbi:HPr family phosphocarrier protein [Georgenia sp. 311]|uniref:HPr family phosphocarrier protein n=1 Tax=Georgenia sp. 311 TaxID=2585134 RepID=UPI0011126C2E|nr:HPr family phosphocarrier protein [Georgenia sp. 311]TNC20137.1 HPr family phosphocarrier protein [Georgenia sp. 311]